MKRVVCAVVLVMLALLASPAFAASPVPIQWVDDLSKIVSVGPGLRGLPTAEQFPSYNKYVTLPGISCTMVSIADQTMDTPPGTWCNRDSTAVIDVRGYKYAALLLFARPTPISGAEKNNGSADSLIGATFALQTRMHASASYDSANTYRSVGWMRRSESGLGTGAVVATNDTVGMMRDLIFARNFNFNPQIISNPLPDEKVVVCGNGVNGGMVIWADRINNPAGGWVTGFMSWRLRALRSFTGTGGTGTPLTPTGELPMRLRMDILLWND